MFSKDTPRTQQLQQLASEFIATQSNRTSLITVTDTNLTNRGSVVTFYVSVFPEEAEGPALGFLMRKRGECKEYIKQHSNGKHVPHVEFVLDTGEKKRQRVDELLSE